MILCFDLEFDICSLQRVVYECPVLIIRPPELMNSVKEGKPDASPCYCNL
jgi:hypothetical protein